MSLYNIGGVRAELHPFNLDSATMETNEDFARHAVLGGRKPFESVGHGDAAIQLRGVIFPRFSGGLAEFGLLETLQSAAQSILVTRGNDKLGWFVIPKLRREDKFLDQTGVGQKITIQIELLKTDRPSFGSAVGLLTQLFGYV